MRAAIYAAVCTILTAGCGSQRPRPADLVALARRIDERCPARSLPTLLDPSSPTAPTCPSEVSELDIELDRGLDEVEFIPNAFERDVPTPGCDAPWHTGQDLAIVAAQATRTARPRPWARRPRDGEDAVLRAALVRYHLRLATDGQWTQSEHDFAREAILRLGLMDVREVWGEAAAPYAILACRPRGPGVWETPDAWVDGRLPGTTATMHGPPMAFILRRTAVDGVELSARAFLGDEDETLASLRRVGVHPPVDGVEGGLTHLETERTVVVVLPGSSMQLVVSARYDDERRRSAIVRAFESLRWDGALPVPPIIAMEGELRWVDHESGRWELCDAPGIGLDGYATRCVYVEASTQPSRCGATSTMPTTDGQWVPACEVDLATPAAPSRVVPTSEGHLRISASAFGHPENTISLFAGLRVVRASR